MRIRAAHISLQYSDTDKQQTADIEKLFRRARDRKYAWITGTEAGDGAGNMQDELLRVGGDSDYRMWVPGDKREGPGSSTDCWIAVRKDLITGDWKKGYEPVIPGSAQLYKEMGKDPDLNPRWGPKGLVWVGFDSLPQIGRVNIAAAHYLTKARHPGATTQGVNHWEWNKKLGQKVGEWGDEVAKGSSLAFYGGDQNMSDAANTQPQGDTFFGAPWTSVGDELKKWANTGHGPIDVIATYNKDGRVKALNTNVLDDREFSLHTDHFLVEALLQVEPLKR